VQSKVADLIRIEVASFLSLGPFALLLVGKLQQFFGAHLLVDHCSKR
jgi:hypothetical protein